MDATPANANFGFLGRYDTALVGIAGLAERYFTDDPVTCLMKLRQFGELLPPAGGGAQDEWLGYAREIFIASLRSWHRNGLGPAAEFLDTLAAAEREKLALL
ncbi:MAG: hypothetical protein ACREFS_08935 [Acetobacteraceae bacterium]